MLPGMELMGCTGLAVPPTVMEHVVRIESSFNPYAIGVVGGRLARQPRNLAEALSTVRMLEGRGYNFSLGLAQVNRHNLARQGLDSYEKAFETCPNLQAGSRILAECYTRSRQDWGKAFSCYYSGNFTTGYRHGYVQKVFASWQARSVPDTTAPIPVVDRRTTAGPQRSAQRVRRDATLAPRVSRRIEEAAARGALMHGSASGVSAALAPVAVPSRPEAAMVRPDATPASNDTPVVVQAYHQTMATPPQAPQAMQTSVRDDAFVF